MATVEPQSLRSSHPELAGAPVDDSSDGTRTGSVDASEDAPVSRDQPIDRQRTDVQRSGTRRAIPGLGERHLVGEIVGPKGWKRRLEDPFNTYYRYPIALVMVRGLVHTPITPNQVSFAQPLLAALAGYMVTFDDWRHMLYAVAAFELRSILDCVDGSLARAKKMASPYGHAIDAMADWLGVTFLYVGILLHFRMHPPTDWGGMPGLEGAPTTFATTMVIVIASVQAAMRSFSFDYFKNKYLSIYESRRDASIEGLRAKVLAVRDRPSLFGHIDVFIGRFGHLVFEREWFDPECSRATLSRDELDAMANAQESARARRMGFVWAVSGGDAFLSQVMLTMLVGQLWAGQVFFASVGVVWILGVVFYNVRFVRTARRGDGAGLVAEA